MRLCRPGKAIHSSPDGRRKGRGRTRGRTRPGAKMRAEKGARATDRGLAAGKALKPKTVSSTADRPSMRRHSTTISRQTRSINSSLPTHTHTHPHAYAPTNFHTLTIIVHTTSSGPFPIPFLPNSSTFAIGHANKLPSPSAAVVPRRPFFFPTSHLRIK